MTEHPGSGMMGLPVRLVCIECLESIEVSCSGSTHELSLCPHCGSYLDPFQQGIQSGVEIDLDSPLTLSMADASTLRSEAPTHQPLRQVGRFQVRQTLGEGGYGQVYRAYDPHLEREVALKVLKPNRLGEKALERFYREARAAARLDHPNIVALHDAGRDEGRCWIAYQLVAGRTLSAARDLDPPSVLDSIRIVRDLALALDHAHGRGVFHRDLKPANVMIDSAGRPRLTDFGLARRDDIVSDLTIEGTVLGTPQYMSPEAAAGRAHEADARSDVYSLGVILYELLCGRRPCDLPSGSPLWRSSQQIIQATPRAVDRAIPAELDQICMKALALNPGDRYANAGLLGDALTHSIANYRPPKPKKARPLTTQSPANSWIGRTGWLVLATTIGVLGVVAAGLRLIRPHAEPVQAAPPVLAQDAAPTAHTVLRPASLGGSPALPGTEPVPDRVKKSPPAGSTAARPPEPAAAAAAEEEIPPFPELPTPTTQVIGNGEKRVFYHPIGCPHLTNMKRPILFDSEEAAIAQHFRPCEYMNHRRKPKP